LLGPIRTLDRHPHDRDRVVHAGDRGHPGQPTSRAHDHLPVHRLAQDPVWRSDVPGSLWRDRGGLQPPSRRAHRFSGVGDDLVAGTPAVLQRQVEALQLELEPQQRRIEHAERLLL
jgi:hypothetical protein